MEKAGDGSGLFDGRRFDNRELCLGRRIKSGTGWLAGRLRNEWKLLDSGLYLLSGALVLLLAVLALFAGELLNVSRVGFEVIFPFFAAVAIGEWGKIRADDNIDLIAAQCESAFSWAAIRYAAVMSIVNLFAAAGMLLICLIRGEMPFSEMLISYFPAAFLLSSLSILTDVLFAREHLAATVCGILWLAELMLQSLLRFPLVQYFYLFAGFAGIRGEVWLVNKGVLCAIGVVIWCGIYFLCK